MLKENDHFQNPPSRSIIKAALEVWGQTSHQHLILISGRSMLPLIQNGASVLVKHGDINIKRGDVIVFMQENRMVAHRVLRIERDEHNEVVFIAKGDNNFHLDPPVKENQVIGRVLKIKHGKSTLAIDTITWQILGRFIALVMLSLSHLYRGIHNLKKL